MEKKILITLWILTENRFIYKKKFIVWLIANCHWCWMPFILRWFCHDTIAIELRFWLNIMLSKILFTNSLTSTRRSYISIDTAKWNRLHRKNDQKWRRFFLDSIDVKWWKYLFEMFSLWLDLVFQNFLRWFFWIELIRWSSVCCCQMPQKKNAGKNTGKKRERKHDSCVDFYFFFVTLPFDFSSQSLCIDL